VRRPAALWPEAVPANSPTGRLRKTETTLPMSESGRKTYTEILKSSAWIGGSSAVNVAFGIVRAKAMALLLGPAGIGWLGLYGSINDLARSLAGLGINSSGVRQIAEAAGTGDTQRLARTTRVLRRVAFVSGALGALLLWLCSRPVSRLTFGDGHHARAVAWLALAALFGDVSAGQAALVQGLRRIADLARMNVLGALYGTVLSILIVYFRRDELGAVLSLVCVAGMSILTSWWYARKICVEAVSLSPRQFKEEASGLLKLGVVFMASGLMTLGSAYLVRLTVIRQFGTEAAGFYQAAWGLGGLYIGFILQAMGTDFYPRLTAVAHQNTECNRLVNEQAEVGLLIAGPGILATLTFAPVIITLFYSHQFWPATRILRWICLGMMLRAVTWPMGFIVVARGEKAIFFWVEILVTAGYAALVWLGVRLFGLEGAGMAFCGLCAAHFAVVYLVVRRLSGFRWSQANGQLALVFAPLLAIVFGSGYFLPPRAALMVGITVAVPAAVYSCKTLFRLVPPERFPSPAQKLAKLFRLWPLSGNPKC
jgi:PST family polysaccharide transporter